MVHRRTIDTDTGSETLIFGVHGALWGNAMTWWDHGTGSIWSQPLGEAIAGPRKGQTVDLLPVEFTSWGSWRSEHPQTLALDAPGGPSGFSIERLLVVVDLGAEVRAYPFADVQTAVVVNDVVADIELAIVSDPRRPERWTVFSRRVDGGQVVELEPNGDLLVDVVSGSTFDPATGVGITGPLAEQNLDPLAGFTSFPGDFDTFWPDGTVWSP